MPEFTKVARASTARRSGARRLRARRRPVVGDAALGVNRSVPQPERVARAAHVLGDPRLRVRRQRATASRRSSPRRTVRRADRACRRSRRRRRAPACQHALERELAAGDVLLDQNLVLESGARAARPRAARAARGCDRTRRRTPRRRSARITPRLPDMPSGLSTQGYRASSARASRSPRHRASAAAIDREPRRRQSSCRDRGARAPLVGARRRARRGVPRQAQRLRRPRGEDDRPIADGDHAVDRRSRARARRSPSTDASTS